MESSNSQVHFSVGEVDFFYWRHSGDAVFRADQFFMIFSRCELSETSLDADFAGGADCQSAGGEMKVLNAIQFLLISFRNGN
jgi:hypothetical protein